MKRGYFALLSLLLSAAAFAAEPARPNVVIFLADDLGYGDLACYGNQIIKTPNLDEFATQGLRLTQCYAGCPVCSPSRSAILTGRTPYRNGVFTWIPAGSEIHLRTSEITLPKLLKQAGYTTCHVGKWHLNGKFNSPEQPQPNDHGYDWWLATQNNAAPNHKNPTNFARNGKALGTMEGFSGQLVVNEAIHWLKKERDASKPFFLSVCTHETHLPIETAPKFRRLYPDFEQNDADRAQHHGNVSQLDHVFGTLMNALDDLKLTRNTMVFFTADNGPEGNGLKGRTRGSTGGLRGRKRDVYEGGIRVAGMIRWPGHIAKGSTSDQPVIGSDLFPTALAVAGVEPPKDRVIDGTSLMPLFEGKKIERKVPMYWRYHDARGGPKIAMRVGDWKILTNLEWSNFEMYNLKDDPKETNNLATKESQKFAEMKAAFVKLNAEIEKEGPTWWKGYKKK